MYNMYDTTGRGNVMDNRTIAKRLTGYAKFLESRHQSLYRVQAYRRAAETVLGLERPVEEIVANEGRKGLQALPGIGSRLSEAIEDLIRTGDIQPPQPKKAKEPVRTLFGLSDYLSPMAS